VLRQRRRIAFHHPQSRLAADHAEQERAAAAVKSWLLAQIDKKRPAPPTDDPMETAPDQPFAPERLAA
jgi:hypothetical protein